MVRDVIGYAGPIVSFEPTRADFGALVETMGGDPAWTGHQLALGSKATSAELNVYSSTVFNSFLSPSHLGEQRFGGLARQSTETVRVARLDQVPDLPGGRLLLKVARRVSTSRSSTGPQE